MCSTENQNTSWLVSIQLHMLRNEDYKMMKLGTGTHHTTLYTYVVVLAI